MGERVNGLWRAVCVNVFVYVCVYVWVCVWGGGVPARVVEGALGVDDWKSDNG